MHTRSRLTPPFTSRGVLAADAPLTVPMFLRLSKFQLSGIIILVFSKQKGLTLVFRNDPVDSVKVSSTFDSIPAIQRFLQAEIERLLRDLMREEVPAIIHKLSLEWAMRNQADECLSPASLTNTEPHSTNVAQIYPYPIDIDSSDPLHPIFSQANIRRLTELSLAQHTLSPFTISIPNSVFRSSASLIVPSRSSALKRRDLLASKSPVSSDPFYPQSISNSPPESVHSTQSVEPMHRPTLYSRRQRSSYLRRSHPPKRKVVRLRASGSHSADNSSVASGSSDYAEYFSEPGGYVPLQDIIHEASGRAEKYETLEQSWVDKSFQHSWTGFSGDIRHIEDSCRSQKTNSPQLPEKFKLNPQIRK